MGDSIKDKYKVISIKPKLTYEWLLKKHYAHRIPSISYAFGLYDIDNILRGVCTFGLPASPELCLTCGIEYKDKTLELNRLCVEQGDKNITSFLVSKSLSLINKPCLIVSYADTAQGHHGYIYQATNWIYTGLSKEQYDLKIKGSNKHSRHVYDNPNLETERVKRSAKHRYFYFLGSKTQIKEMKSKFKYVVLPYPKGENKRYDASYQTTNQETLFV